MQKPSFVFKYIRSQNYLIIQMVAVMSQAFLRYYVTVRKKLFLFFKSDFGQIFASTSSILHVVVHRTLTLRFRAFKKDMTLSAKLF